MAIGEQIDLISIARGDRSLQQIGDAIGGYYARQRQQQQLDEARAYQDTRDLQNREFERENATLRYDYANKLAERTAQLATERDRTATLRQLALKGFPIDPKLTVEENIAKANEWLVAKEEKEVKGAANNLKRYTQTQRELQDELERNAEDFQRNIMAEATKAYLEQVPEEDRKAIAAKLPKGLPPQAAQKKLMELVAEIPGIVPLNEMVESIRSDTKHPVVQAHSTKERMMVRQLNDNNEALNRFMNTATAQKALTVLADEDAVKLEKMGQLNQDLGAVDNLMKTLAITGEQPATTTQTAQVAPAAQPANPAFNPEAFAPVYEQNALDVDAGRLRRDLMMKARGLDAMSVLSPTARPESFTSPGFATIPGAATTQRRPGFDVDSEARARLVNELLKDPATAAKLGIQLDPGLAQRALALPPLQY